MRTLIAASITAAVLLAAPQLAFAQAQPGASPGASQQNAQFCLKRGSGSPSCMYQTMAACNQAKGTDASAQCMSKTQADQTTGAGSPNPGGAPSPAAPAPR
jgi:hypothetical protein